MLSALDLLRRLCWALISFIYDLIDTIFNILKELNLYDIVESVSDNSVFANFHLGILAIAISFLGLFSIWKFVMKILEPDEEMSTNKIVTEIVKCSLLVLISVFLFTEANSFSLKLSNYTGSIFDNGNITISDSMLGMYINYSEGYMFSEDYDEKELEASIKNDSFSDKRMYNDKYVTSQDWVVPNEKEYKYEISWIMAIIVGGFFLYALFFSGMMLARRQIEFLFLFIISPVIFATSIGNKQRRSAVIEQLVSLVLQSAVVMLIIGITIIILQAVNNTTFFTDSVFKDMALKSIMFIGCATFLITGSQVINRFIGSNVSANSGREQLMSLMSFSNTFTSATHIATTASVGAGAFGLGVASSVAGKAGGNTLVSNIGSTIQNFGNKVSSGGNNQKSNYFRNNVGNVIEKFGSSVKTNTPSNIGKNMRTIGKENMSDAVSSIIPQRNTNRNRYRR